MVEINGQRYMDTKEASSIWHIPARRIAEGCPEIPGTIKLKSKWYIPVTARKPLQSEERKQLLLLTLQLKNDSTQKLDYSLLPFDIANIRFIYEDLVYGKYIQPFQIDNSAEIPYKVILTEKGLKTAVGGCSGQHQTKFGIDSLKLGIELFIMLYNTYTQNHVA